MPQELVKNAFQTESFQSELIHNAREQAKRNVVEQTAQNAAYSLKREASAIIPSLMNDVSKMHDATIYFQNDIQAYHSRKFYELLKQKDTENQVTIVDEASLSFTPGKEFKYGELPYELYNSIQAELQKLPVYTELGRLAQVIDSSYGGPVHIATSALTEEDQYIFLRTLGLTRESIDTLHTTKETISLEHSPGFSITLQEDTTLMIDYSPEPLALKALEKTLLWRKTGEEIMEGLGKAHLSNNLQHILSEGHIDNVGPYTFQSRYGNGYADVTRVLSHCIGKDRHAVYNLIWNDPDHEFDEETKEKWLALSKESTSPAAYFFKLLYDVTVTQFDADTSRNEENMAQYPRFKLCKIIAPKDGSCKDAENYYCGASREALAQSSPYFLEKQSYGSATSLVLSPVMVNGVLLQPGHLVKLEKDGNGTITGVQPLRSTMFMFSEAEAADAFTWQHQATLENLSSQHITPLTNLSRKVL